MRSFFVKGSLVLALAAAFGMPNASAAPLVAVEPTVAVVDGNHAAIVGANGLLNAFIYATNQIFEKREGDFHKSLKKKSFDPREILPPAAVVNFAYAQTKGKAVSLNEWAVRYDKGKIVYKVSFGTEDNKEVHVRMDAMNGKLLSVKFDN